MRDALDERLATSYSVRDLGVSKVSNELGVWEDM